MEPDRDRCVVVEQMTYGGAWIELGSDIAHVLEDGQPTERWGAESPTHTLTMRILDLHEYSTTRNR